MMNKHFEDTVYYLRRAGEHAKLGLTVELETLEKRVRDVTGHNAEPEPSRLESILEDLKTAEQKAEDEAREALGTARARLESYRSRE